MWSMTTVSSGFASICGTRSGSRAGDVRIVIGTLSLRAAPPEWRHQRAANPVAVRGGCGVQPDTAKSLLGELTQVIWSGGIFWIYPADTVEKCGIAFQNAEQIAIVPAVIDHLNENCPRDSVGPHQLKQHFYWGIFELDLRSFGVRKLRIVLEHVNVGVDHDRLCDACARLVSREAGGMEGRVNRQWSWRENGGG